MSTRREHSTQAERLALVATSGRERLLMVHRHRLPRAELEDCYSQATLELLELLGRGVVFCGTAHLAKALEQRLLSRVRDRQRAVGGRSPIEAALASSVSLTGLERGVVEIADERAGVERIALARHELRRLTELFGELPHEQRLVLASQLERKPDRTRFCRAHGWSGEKYRKLGQRARARLRARLAEESESGGRVLVSA